MDTQKLRREHRSIMGLASRLGGVASDIKTRGDAHDVRVLIQVIDEHLQDHLAAEDSILYPALIDAGDADTRTLGVRAFEEMGGIVGVWTDYCDRWTVEAVLKDAPRFAAATRSVLGALSLRMEMENDILYPAMDRLTAGAARAAA